MAPLVARGGRRRAGRGGVEDIPRRLYSSRAEDSSSEFHHHEERTFLSADVLRDDVISAGPTS
jgi:hypothetical protein